MCVYICIYDATIHHLGWWTPSLSPGPNEPTGRLSHARPTRCAPARAPRGSVPRTPNRSSREPSRSSRVSLTKSPSRPVRLHPRQSFRRMTNRITRMTKQFCKMAELVAKWLTWSREWLSTVAKMTDMILKMADKIIKWLSTVAKNDWVHYSKGCVGAL
jgi:hypothetical protein